MQDRQRRLLETQLNLKNFKVADNYNIMLYDTDVSVAEINRAFILNNIEVSESHLCEDTLEDYFKKVTGGEGIA